MALRVVPTSLPSGLWRMDMNSAGSFASKGNWNAG